VIDYPGWEADYEKICADLFSQIPAERITWISLGCLRFMPSLKPIMQKRFPKSRLSLAEWITGMDGKMRYFKPKRIEIYRKMMKMIRTHSSDRVPTVYLTMESPEVWRRVFGTEHTKESVCKMLDKAGSTPELNLAK